VHLTALNRKWVLAYAHIRGGNEKGHQWHQSATKLNKLRSIEDLQGCVHYLVAHGYTHPSLLCAYAASAGATNLAAAINMRPDLFKGVILSVPFLDVLGSLSDNTLPLTVSDYGEFGNPCADESTFEYIRSYSPYENLQPQVYPAMYIRAGTDDYRSPMWGVMKYVGRFRQAAKDSVKVDNILNKGMLVEILEGGHYGVGGV
jgi:oligopeptidase B